MSDYLEPAPRPLDMDALDTFVFGNQSNEGQNDLSDPSDLKISNNSRPL